MTRALLLTMALAVSLAAQAGKTESSAPRLIEVVADRDSHYRISGVSTPSITVKPGERILLRVTANKAKTWNRDGSIHGFTLLRKDRSKVPGWNLLLKPGKNEFELTAPSEPGEYIVICTVICSDDHDQMNMKFFVVQ